MTVYVTHGTKYHLDSACPRMTAGEDLWDGDSEDWWHNSGSFRREVDTVRTAAYLGKLPCLFCTDKATRVFPPLYGQTFGHEPIDEYQGTPEGDLGVTHMACKRCKVWTHWKSVGFWIGTRVSWPCTSAVVLGLAEHPSA